MFLRAVLVLSIVCCRVPVQAGTDVSGTIASNTVWTLSGSPYVVTGNVFVNPGVTLTIEPGVVVRFAFEQSLIVDGTIRAVGLPSSYISFEPDTDVVEDFWWGGVLLRTQAEPYDYSDQSGCFFQYCRFGYSGTPNLFLDPGGNSAFTVFSAVSLGFDHCMVENSACGVSGGANSQVTMSEFRECAVDAFSGPIVKVAQNSLVTNNLFYKNAVASSTGMLSVNKNVTVANNLFIENEFVFYNSLFFEDTCSFHHNSLVDNVGLALEVNGGKIFNNLLTRNEVDIQTIELFTCDPVMYDNNILGNHSNVFGSEVEVLAAESTGSTALIQDSYWGASDSVSIAAFVDDQSDDADLCRIDYVPFLVSPSVNAPLIPPVSAWKQDLQNGTVKVWWTAGHESDLKGYKVYWGGFTGTEFTNFLTVTGDTTATISGVGINEAIAVTSIDQESDDILDQYEAHESWFTYTQIVVGGISQPEQQTRLLVYPNPAPGLVTVEITGSAGPVSISVTDLMGMEVLSYTNLATAFFEMELPKAGIYFVKVITGQQVLGYQKIIRL